MSAEISISLSVSVAKGGFARTFNFSGSVDLASAKAAGGTQNIGTAEEDLGAGDILTAGLLVMKNLDATNFVTWGMSDAGTMKAVGKLKPGEIALLRVKPGVTVRMLADTAAVDVDYLFLND